MTETEINFRIAKPEDAATLINIYQYYVKQTAITAEITVPSVEEFQRRIKNTLPKYPYLVALLNNKIVGYAYVSSFNDREAYRYDVETSIYLDKNERGHHIGTKLYKLLEQICQAMGIINMMSCITYPHAKEDEHLTLASPKFHQYFGYHLVGKFDRCINKFDTWYDMIWMQKTIGDFKQKQPVKSFSEVKNQFNLD